MEPIPLMEIPPITIPQQRIIIQKYSADTNQLQTVAMRQNQYAQTGKALMSMGA